MMCFENPPLQLWETARTKVCQSCREAPQCGGDVSAELAFALDGRQKPERPENLQVAGERTVRESAAEAFRRRRPQNGQPPLGILEQLLLFFTRESRKGQVQKARSY
jgi:hypothetical protein